MNNYRADYEDGDFEIIQNDSDSEALNEAWDGESEHGTLFNLFEIDSDYNAIRTVV